MKILILGGYGVFGGRLARLLSDLPQLTLLIGGRKQSRAEAFCDEFSGSTKLVPIAIDRSDIAACLAEHQPDMLVDASGPFQDYGSDRYSVVEACIAARTNYLDFADAADFVFGVSQFDEAAVNAGVLILSGVSSFPVLTAAVLREFARDMEIIRVEGGIAPSPHAGIGLNVMRAVVSYAGAPVKLWRNGIETCGAGLAESRRFTIAVPGRMPLRNIRFSLVDVPDLQVLPPEYPTMTDIWIGAGPVPELLHRMLNVLAKMRARFQLPSLEPLSRLFYNVLNLMKFGEHRGGMYVSAQGVRDGKPVERSWHLLAEGDDGPFIPSMAAEAIIRKVQRGELPRAGARPATRELGLSDYENLFSDRTIYMGFREENPDEPIYRKLLGPAFDQLPAEIRRLHDSTEPRSWSGSAEVIRGRGLLARAVAAVIGFPKEGTDIPVTVVFEPGHSGERWTRTFANKSFSSFQSCGTGRNRYLLTERFGIATVALALLVKDKRLYLVPRRFKVLGIPLPKFLLPRGTSFEAQTDGRFQFNVTISFPIIGDVVQYRGHLTQVGWLAF